MTYILVIPVLSQVARSARRGRGGDRVAPGQGAAGLLRKMAIERVDLPMKHGEHPQVCSLMNNINISWVVHGYIHNS